MTEIMFDGDPRVYHLLEQSASFYVVQALNADGSAFLNVFPKSLRHSIRERRWVNVTGECTVIEKDGLGDQQSIRHHDNGMVCYTQPGSPYRLRKVDGSLYCFGSFKDAFIIEQQEPT